MKPQGQITEKEIEAGKKVLDEATKDIGGISTSDQALAKSIASLTSKSNIELLTDLPHSDECKLLTALTMQAQALHPDGWQNSVVGMFVKNYPEWRVSHKRKGRTEIFGIAKAIKEEQAQESRIKRFLKFW